VFKTLYSLVITEEKRKENFFSLLTPRIGLDVIDPHSTSRLDSEKGLSDQSLRLLLDRSRVGS
jgi:hypothetical protein